MGKISFADLRARCAELGITPGRSAEETQRRIDHANVTRQLNDTSHKPAPRAMSRTMRKLADSPLTPAAVLLGR